MERLIIRNARVIDPAAGLDGVLNIYCMGGRIASVKKAETDTTPEVSEAAGTLVIDAAGLLVVPGLVDVHTHLREPGFEYKETIETGARSAAAGGFTTLLCMANTAPVNDNESVTRYILKKAASAAVNVSPIGAVSMGLAGERLTEMTALKAAGCVAFSDDGVPVADSALMRRALEYAGGMDAPVVSHAEDPALAGRGVMNEGAVATRLGLAGIPGAAEDSVVARDISLAELTGAHLHVAHVSTRGAVGLIRAAKERGVRVTAEATPHHLCLTDEAVAGYDTNAKMNPPLRSRADVDALREGLKDGAIDCVATDHAPQSVIEKDVEFDAAANGIIGLETAFSLVYALVEQGVLTLAEAVAAMTSRPAAIFGLNAGTIKVGAPADMAMIDLERSWTVEAEEISSRSRNSPFIGAELKARVVRTIVSGVVVHEAGSD